MKIKSLKLINYRCFKEFEIDLQESFTLLVGNNGSGKSTVLDGLAVGLASFFLGMDGASSGSIHPNDVRVESFVLGRNPCLPLMRKVSNRRFDGRRDNVPAVLRRFSGTAAGLLSPSQNLRF